MPQRLTLSRDRFDAAIFDLDGVVTDTASAHFAAWKETFDELLARQPGDEPPFSQADYRRYVDGLPRFDGIRSFLKSRDIELAEGTEDDPPGYDTVFAVGMEKNRRYHKHLQRGEIEIFDDTVALIRRLKAEGFGLALVSSSRNARQVLEITGLDELFDHRVDGTTLAELDLPGKPAPDMFLEAARRLDASPKRCIVVEDAESGVAAGKAGGFGLVVGLAVNSEEREALREAGADIALKTMQSATVGT